MGGRNFIPRPDGDCAAWAVQFAGGCDAEQSKLGLAGKQVTDIKIAVDAFVNALNAHTAAQRAAESARQTKDAQRAALEQLVRPYVRVFQSAPGVTDAIRAELGITVRDTSKTPSPTPTSAPVVQVESGQRLTHRLKFTDGAERTGSPTRRGRGGKPPGTIGAEVWLALTPPHEPAPPLNPPTPGAGGLYKFLSVSSRGNLQTDFPSAEAGKTAYYALRWVSTRGEKGPWSEVAAATVAA
jgi:hypothetical protein